MKSMMSYFTKIAVFSMLCLIAEVGLLRADTTTDLSQKLAIIDGKRDGSQTRAQKLEQECLSLLANVSVAEDSGLVYAEMALIYARNGLIQPEKFMAYGKLALQYPLADTLAAPLYVSWAAALQMQYLDDSFKGDKSALKTEIAGTCMNGLKQIMLHDLSQATRHLPLVIVFDCPPSDPAYENLVKENRDSLALCKEIFKQQDLVRYRNELIDKLVYLSKLDPRTKSEIEKLASSILVDPDKTKEVLSLIDKKLSSK